MGQPRKIALIGNPNAGKSSVFNLLTGMRQRTGNFPGVTVEAKIGNLTLKSEEVDLIDLPGTYSLYPNSLDEFVVLEALLPETNKPDLLLYIADYQHIDRQLLLLTQVVDLGYPCVLALTMTDVYGTPTPIEIQLLSEELGVGVCVINGRTGDGLEALKNMLQTQLCQSKIAGQPFQDLTSDEHKLVKEINLACQTTNNGLAYRTLLLAHHHQQLTIASKAESKQIAQKTASSGFQSIKAQISETLRRYDRLDRLMHRLGRRKAKPETQTLAIDRWLTHPVWGILIFFGVMLLVFQSIYTVADLPVTWIQSGISFLGQSITAAMGKSGLQAFVVNGLLEGVSNIFSLVPPIAILFLVLGLLEEVGYMARVAFLLDGLMNKLGLNGRSVVNLIAGGACAIPAIMGTRTIGNRKERLLTILVTPLIPCSARIPVFLLLVGFLIPDRPELQGLIMTSFYLLGIATALLVAVIFNKILKIEDRSFLLLELPNYHRPHWKNLLLSVYDRVRSFIVGAGKIIFIITIILWLTMNYGPSGAMDAAKTRATSEAAAQNWTPEDKSGYISDAQARASYAGIVGQWIEPAIKPLGYDWKIGLGLVASFAAREVFVSTMNSIYHANVEDEEKDMKVIRDYMRRDRNSITGKPTYTPATAVSLLLFFLFALQCMSTLAIVRKETGSWKWPIIQFLLFGAIAYLSAFVAYQLMS
jgi:ferrous iron transport protein B